LERLRREALSNEASALAHAERKGAVAERERWQGVVAGKDAEIAGKDAAIAGQAAEIAKLRALLGGRYWRGCKTAGSKSR
jgi:hypothetical protein